MKKKNQPYLLFAGAALLGFIGVFAVIKYNQNKEAEKEAAVAAAQAAAAQELADAKAKQVTVTETPDRPSTGALCHPAG